MTRTFGIWKRMSSWENCEPFFIMMISRPDVIIKGSPFPSLAVISFLRMGWPKKRSRRQPFFSDHGGTDPDFIEK